VATGRGLPRYGGLLADGLGVDRGRDELIVVSRALGHSTISTTADVYAHVTPATLQRSAERMDDILRRKAADSA
jgi:integrase